jgi:uncharacterized protein (TIGR02453 family)
MQFEKETLQYLGNLYQNNNRDWFADQKETYQKVQQNAKDVFAAIHQELQKHDEIEKSKMMRIYRDVRFSKDKTPYKTHFANSFSRLGTTLRGGYFLKISPGASFLAGGFWEPSKEDLFRIRKEIELDASEIKAILKDPSYLKHFGGTFESFSELKTAPRGFDKEHPEVALLRKKGFIASRRFTDAEVMSPKFVEEVNTSFKALRPFFNLFSDILSTNLNGEPIV